LWLLNQGNTFLRRRSDGDAALDAVVWRFQQSGNDDADDECAEADEDFLEHGVGGVGGRWIELGEVWQGMMALATNGCLDGCDIDLLMVIMASKARLAISRSGFVKAWVNTVGVICQ
jgi:hypothetical protein